MPDAWEYPWFASWGLAYRAAALARADPAAACQQLLLLLDDRYLSPSGAIPAYRLDPEGRNLTAWTAILCLDLAAIAAELAVTDPVYEDLAVSFVEHFAYVATALDNSGLWDDEDGFCYDLLRRPDASMARWPEPADTGPVSRGPGRSCRGPSRPRRDRQPIATGRRTADALPRT